MASAAILVYQQREEYKAGWAYGFYSCRLDDGASCRSRSNLPEKGPGAEEEAARLFWFGYRDGQACARRDGSFRGVTNGAASLCHTSYS